MRIPSRLLALGASAAIIFAACGPGATTAPTGTDAAPTDAASTEPTTEPVAFKACLVTDTGGLGDKGFNDNALKGLNDALEAGYASEVKNLESNQDSDYASNIDLLVTDGCQQITTVGFHG